MARHKPDLAAIAASGKETAPAASQHSQRKAAPQAKPKLIRMSDILPTAVQWLWRGRIPLGRLMVIVGMPGVGKSFFTAELAAHVSTGQPFPDGSPCPPGSAIIVSAEDDPADTIRPRLDAQGADASRIHLLAAVQFTAEDGSESERAFTLADLPALAAALEANTDCKLVIIDPIGSYLGGKVNANRDNEVRAVLAPLAELASKHGVAVVIVMHRRKSDGDFADDSALGSRAFTGIARAVYHMSRDSEDKDRFLFLPGKCNLTAAGDGLAFRIEGTPPRIVWEADPVAMNADDAQAAEARTAAAKRRPGTPGPIPASRQAAAEFLESYLASGPKPPGEIKAEAEKAGHTPRTVERAADELGIVRERSGFGGGTLWRLPGEPARQVPQEPENLASWRECENKPKNVDTSEAATTPAKLQDAGGNENAADKNGQPETLFDPEIGSKPKRKRSEGPVPIPGWRSQMPPDSAPV